MYFKQKDPNEIIIDYIVIGLWLWFMLYMQQYVCVKVIENNKKVSLKINISHKQSLQYSLNKNLVFLSSQDGNTIIDSIILHKLMHGLKFKGFCFRIWLC